MSTILAFVNARLDEREAAAKAAFPGPWRYNPAKQWHLPDDYPSRRNGEEFVAAGPLDAATCVAATGPADHPQSMVDATFIALNDPAYVLADIAAKRRILGWAQTGALPEYEIDYVLTALAAPFAQHADFAPAWAVEA
jgi:hypothetical protein